MSTGLSRMARIDMRLEPVDMEKLFRGVLDVYPNLQPPHAEIRIESPLPPVLGNEAALTQSISNLLGNAVKFVAPDVLPQVRVWAQEKGDCIRFYFQDNGIGIAPDHQERIFNMFERLHSTTDYPGTGIGLAIVRKSVELMGGKAGVESEPGKGSTFWLELNRATPLETPGSG
jgi:signal transduction histidine kinase